MAASDAVCLVADPSGTPLNVRSRPNGDIVATLDNGVRVLPFSQRMDRGKLWMRVEVPGGLTGWVFASYLDCASGTPAGKAPVHITADAAFAADAAALPDTCLVADPSSTPLNVRSRPNGDIVATLENGVKVTPVSQRMDRGKLWMNVDVPGGLSGWVFASYLDCAPGLPAGKAPVHITAEPEPEQRPDVGAQPSDFKSAPMKPRPSPG
ncbi:SH3 domain-containing protein [Rhizobium sp. RU20A]|uniref:SH3 domain-containing protein n=1 Tax=Rhizobium sp. RU20A TaxID=1907412 RepID=UPI001AEF2073|nr:SH3 domain-containing protein [Rhizobium sp. RU20A]